MFWERVLVKCLENSDVVWFIFVECSYNIWITFGI